MIVDAPQKLWKLTIGNNKINEKTKNTNDNGEAYIWGSLPREVRTKIAIKDAQTNADRHIYTKKNKKQIEEN